MTEQKRRFLFHLIGSMVLLAGLAAAIWIYITTGDAPPNAIGYEIVNGQAYAITADDSKLYRRDLERIGGKSAIFADDLNRWFASLWQGKRLAYTIALLAFIVALGCFWAADDQSPEQADKQKR